MRKLMRLVMMVLLWMCLSASALAENTFLPELTGFSLEEQPLEVKMQVDVQSHMPFGEERLTQFNAMLRHLSLRLGFHWTDDALWSQTTVLCDEEEVMSFNTRREDGMEQVQFSFLPDESYQWPVNDATLMGVLGSTSTDVDLWSLDEWDESWLEDALILLDGMLDAMPEKVKTSKISTSIKGIGKATQKQVLTIPSSEAEGLGSRLAGLVPEGKVQAMLEKLTFSGKQTITVWRNSSDSILRLDYAGKAGLSQEDMRDVSLIWKMLRGSEKVLDTLTLRTPRVKGSGRNNVVFSRTLTMKDEQSTLAIDLRYEVLENKVKNVLTSTVDLTRKVQTDGTQLSGKVTVKRQTDSEDAESLTLEPELMLTMDSADCMVTGKLALSQSTGKKLKEQATIQLEVRPGNWMSWELQPSVIEVNEDNISSVQTRLMQEATVALVRHLVLLPEEDTAFLSAGLAPEVWQQIVDAARSALQ